MRKNICRDTTVDIYKRNLATINNTPYEYYMERVKELKKRERQLNPKYFRQKMFVYLEALEIKDSIDNFEWAGVQL